MKKIKTLFVIDRNTDMATDVLTAGAEWVIRGEGKATIKFDGSSAYFAEGKLFKRFDRKLKSNFSKMARSMGDKFVPEDHMFNEVPEGAIPCEAAPAAHSLHFPHWVPVGDGPEDKFHREALENAGDLKDGATYELVGPKVNGNPYKLERHELWEHGSVDFEVTDFTFEGLKKLFAEKLVNEEGLVFHHPDGRMIKLRNKDFSFATFGKFDERSKKKK
jgi:hypothetical protein